MTGNETPLSGGNMSTGVVRIGDTVRRPAGPWTPAVHNLITGGRQWAFIDWDTAAPGTRLWDLAYAMHGFAPLSASPAYQRDDADRRLRLIADAYGLTERQRLDIIPLLARRTQAMHTFLAQQAAQGSQPWARLWQEGHGDAWQADASYITQRADHWRQALLR